MGTAYPRLYRSFDDFEKNELRNLDHLYSSVDDMVDELIMSELDDSSRDHSDEGNLFDRVEE